MIINTKLGGTSAKSSIFAYGGLASTDTVSCTNGTTTYTGTWDAKIISGETVTGWKFSNLPLGTYTVSANNGSKTITSTVSITAVADYNVEMEYYHYLYNEGAEYRTETGGWSVYNSSGTYMVKGDTSVTINTSTGDFWSNFYPANTIDTTGYTSVHFLMKINMTAHQWNHIEYGSFTSLDGTGARVMESGYCETLLNEAVTDTQLVDYSVSLVDKTTTTKIGLSANRYSGTYSLELTKIWLE